MESFLVTEATMQNLENVRTAMLRMFWKTKEVFFYCPECKTVFQRDDYEAYLRGDMPELETPVGFYDYDEVYNEDDEEIVCLDHPSCDGTIGKKNGKYYCRKCGK